MRILMGLIQAFDMEVRETNMILQKAQAKMTIACTGFERQTEKAPHHLLRKLCYYSEHESGYDTIGSASIDEQDRYIL